MLAMTASVRRVGSSDARVSDREEGPRSGTIKAGMGATHLLMRALKRVRIEMALHVLAYTLARVRKILGITPLIAAMRPVGRWPIRRPHVR